jgi:DNA-binding PadR family transcriptional regulator
MIRYIGTTPEDEPMVDWHGEFGKTFAKAQKVLRKRGPFGGGPVFGVPEFGTDPQMDARMRRGGRRGFGEAERGSVKYDILSILWDGPRHGYDLMLTIEEKRGYRPSPGSVYPALQMLEEGDFLTGKEIDGKRVYTITDKGSELLAKHRETSEGSPADDDTSHVALIQRFMQTMMGVKSVLKEISRTRDTKKYAAALKIVENARRELYDVLSGE